MQVLKASATVFGTVLWYFIDIDSILLQMFNFKSRFNLDKSKGYAVLISLYGVK